jgi:hypothetical protein
VCVFCCKSRGRALYIINDGVGVSCFVFGCFVFFGMNRYLFGSAGRKKRVCSSAASFVTTIKILLS